MNVPVGKSAAEVAQDARDAAASKEAEREISVQVGQQITTLRCARGLSQGALAKKIGVTYQQVQKYEKGANAVSIPKLHALCKALGVDAQTFLCNLPPVPRGAVDPRAAARTAFVASLPGVRFLDNLLALPAHARRMTFAGVAALALGVPAANKAG